MSLAAIPAYFLARRVVRPRARARRRRADGRGAVDALHRHADDRERVLPAVPLACAAARARRSSGRPRSASDRAARRSARSRSRPARRRWRSSPRSRRAPLLLARRARTLARVPAARTALRPARRGAAARARRRRPRAAARRSRCSAPTAHDRDRTTTLGGILHFFLYHVAELDLYVGIVPFAALCSVARAAPRDAGARALVAATSLAIASGSSLEVAAFASASS